MADREPLELAIAAQERLRGVVPDEVVDSAVMALRQQLATLDDAGHRRRQVTVLFADVSGFTAMSERMDAEDVASVMNSLWSRLDDVIRHHGGRIDKHIGDAVMALWGADGTHEDDAEQAVHAALALHEALAEFRQGTGLALAMRVGVNTGPVLLGSVGTTSEFTAMGDAVNVASRLEHAAPLGGVLVSHDTYRHVRGVFDVQPLEPLRLKGKAEPVRTYVVERAKPRTFRVPTRGVEGVETSTVGRQRELATLCAAYEASRVAAGVRLVTVVGEAGIGKSRLLYEFRNWIELRPEGVYLLTGRALAGQEHIPLGLLRDVVATRLGVLSSDPPAVVADKLRQGLAPSLMPDEADVLGHWLGFELGPSPAVRRLTGSPEFGTVAAAHLRTWLGELTRHEPGVLLLEDLHWADTESLDVIARLVLERDDLHLLVVGLTRPGLVEHHPGWPATHGRSVRVELGPLPDEAARELVGDVLQHADVVPDRLVDLIVGRADGNAFYIEELVKMLVDDGVIRVGTLDEPWRVHLDRLDESRVPGTLTGVLQARLDGLSGTERAALQRASVVGRIFWDAAVAALHGSPDATAITSAIEGARRRELVHLRPQSAFTRCSEYTFKHALLRDVAYDTVLLRDRQRLHALAAAWLEQVAGERVSEYREAIAAHLELAGDAEAAAGHLWRVGEAAMATGNAVAARRALTRAMELWREAGTDPLPAALVELAEAHVRLGEFERAGELLNSVERAAPTDPVVLPRALYTASLVAEQRGEHERERMLLDRAVAAIANGDDVTNVLVLIGLAWWAVRHSTIEEATRHGTAALDLALTHGDLRHSARAEAMLGVAAAMRSDLEQARLHQERELQYAEQSGDLIAVALAHGNIAVRHHLEADADRQDGARAVMHYREARRSYEQQRSLCRRLGARLIELTASANLAQVCVRLGDDETAGRTIREALSGLVQLGPTHLKVFCLSVEADRLIERGELETGLALLGALRSQHDLDATDVAEFERILARTPLNQDEAAALMATGAELDLDDIVRRMLSEERDRGVVPRPL